MVAIKAMVVLALATLVSGSAIPIWELLTKQEKMGRLMYVFIHLVDQYCKDSSIPDCQKVLTLYGMSNLVSAEENTLDFMDPYQRDSRTIIWEKVMKGDFKIRSDRTFYSNDYVSADSEDYDMVNEVQDGPTSYYTKDANDPHPYAVRVPAPAKFASAHARSSAQGTNIPENYPYAKFAATHAASAAQASSISESHPYAVRVAPEATTPAPGPVGIKPSADFEPMMSESRPVPSIIKILLPNGRRVRSAPSPAFPEQDMQDLVNLVLGQ